MAITLLQDTPVNTAGNLPEKGTAAPSFHLTNNKLQEISSDQFRGKKLILSIFPSIDTAVCATSVKKFNEKATQLHNATVLCVSADLPFAYKRFCAAEGINNVITASIFRHPEFGINYGVTLTDGPLKGLLARALVVIDENGIILHEQLVPQIAEEPNYDAAIAAL